MSRVQVRTGSTALDQFKCDYLPRTFPFVYPHHIGTPDFKRHSSRRVEQQDLPPVLLPEYARFMARRVEYQVRSDWQFLGGLWNLLFKTLVNHAPSLSFQFSSTAGCVGDVDAESVGAAAVSLSKKLWHGEYTTSTGRRKPISGDITKLGYAIGLSLTERKILKNFHYMSDRVPGTREIRREIGQIVFSAMMFMATHSS